MMGSRLPILQHDRNRADFLVARFFEHKLEARPGIEQGGLASP